MPTRADEIQRDRERLLANAVRPVAGELRLVDMSSFISSILMQKHANLDDVVTSSAELYFKTGTLSFGWGAEVRFGWDVPPTVSLDMEFQNLGVTAFFRLELKDLSASVSLRKLTVEGATDADSETRRLRAAIDDAAGLALSRRPAGSFPAHLH